MPDTTPLPQINLSIIIPALHEVENLKLLLPDLRAALDELKLQWEILVIDGQSRDGTIEIVEEFQMRCIEEPNPGYGAALKRGFAEAGGTYILTMDADLSHPTTFIKSMWEAREKASLVIASRYVQGGGADQNPFRAWLSKVLNRFFRIGFGLAYTDLSSGFRLYRADAIKALSLSYSNFVILIEIILHFEHADLKIAEVPFYYEPRYSGASKARIIQFGKDYLKLFFQMKKLRKLK